LARERIGMALEVMVGAPTSVNGPAFAFRCAVEDDAGELAELEPPSRIATLATASTQRARRLQRGFLRAALASGDTVIVAEVDGTAIGYAHLTTREPRVRSDQQVRVARRTLGVFAMPYAAALTILERSVGHAPLDDSLHIVGVYVASSDQGRGIGTRLLDIVERMATAQGSGMSLTVAFGNPARRLYERRGFVVVGGTRRSLLHKLVGHDGRVLMVKAPALRIVS
jgi:ribosomal protein S18 acetylase RimI-like enzyme